MIFGSFGLSSNQRASYNHALGIVTVIDIICVHPSQPQELDKKLNIWYEYAHIPYSLVYSHQIVTGSDLHFLPFWYFRWFAILPILTVIETSYCIYLCISSTPTYTKQTFSEIYEHFRKIHTLFTSLRHFNFMCFDMWATKTKLCVLG